MTGNAYSKKKQPQLVRHAILTAAEHIAVTEGAAAVTIQAVANAAGVTKGGVLHHFASKQRLIEEMLANALKELDAEIEQHLGDGPPEHGCFTRAYVEVLLMSKQFGVNSPFDALSLMSIAEPGLANPWNDWLRQRLERHHETDGDPALEIVRLAADGAWLAYLGQVPDTRLEHLRTHLIDMTRTH